MREYDTDPDSGFNAVTKLYKTNPTLENYVKLRRENPDAEIEVAIHGGLDQLFYMVNELEKFGIDPSEMASVFDADPSYISQIALQLMEKLLEVKSMRDAGQTHLIRRGLAVPDKLIDWFIKCALDSLSWNNELEIPRDLIVLIRERLGGAVSDYLTAARVDHMKSNAVSISAQLKAKGIKPTYRMVGNALGVSASTVMRWFEPGEFERETDIRARSLDEKGNFKWFGFAPPSAGVATK